MHYLFTSFHVLWHVGFTISISSRRDRKSNRGHDLVLVGLEKVIFWQNSHDNFMLKTYTKFHLIWTGTAWVEATRKLWWMHRQTDARTVHDTPFCTSLKLRSWIWSNKTRGSLAVPGTSRYRGEHRTHSSRIVPLYVQCGFASKSAVVVLQWTCILDTDLIL